LPQSDRLLPAFAFDRIDAIVLTSTLCTP